MKELVLVPLGERVPPELEQIEKGLASRLNGVKISVGNREDLPAGVYNEERGAVIWEKLNARLRDEPGRIYVIEQDLSGVEGGYAFDRYDIAHARAAVSLSRLRDFTGKRTAVAMSLEAELLNATQHRLQSLILGLGGTLLGLSHPCDQNRCVMRERRAVTDFALTTAPFCPEHTKQLAQAIAGVKNKP